MFGWINLVFLLFGLACWYLKYWEGIFYAALGLLVFVGVWIYEARKGAPHKERFKL